MTKPFTASEWKLTDSGLVFEFEIAISDEKPIIQVYQTEGNIARDTPAEIIIDGNTLRLEVNVAFDGYVVVKY